MPTPSRSTAASASSGVVTRSAARRRDATAATAGTATNTDRSVTPIATRRQTRTTTTTTETITGVGAAYEDKAVGATTATGEEDKEKEFVRTAGAIVLVLFILTFGWWMLRDPAATHPTRVQLKSNVTTEAIVASVVDPLNARVRALEVSVARKLDLEEKVAALASKLDRVSEEIANSEQRSKEELEVMKRAMANLAVDVSGVRLEASAVAARAKEMLESWLPPAVELKETVVLEEPGAASTAAALEEDIQRNVRLFTEMEGTGRRDVASVAAGATVAASETSPTFWDGTRLGLWASGVGPDLAISASPDPHACWPCAVGESGEGAGEGCRLGVHLRNRTRVDAITLEHAPKPVSTGLRHTFPLRQFRVWVRDGGSSSSSSTGLVLASGNEPLEYAFDDSAPRAQTFALPRPVWADTVVLEVLSSHDPAAAAAGEVPVACVSRFRVHPVG